MEPSPQHWELRVFATGPPGTAGGDNRQSQGTLTSLTGASGVEKASWGAGRCEGVFWDGTEETTRGEERQRVFTLLGFITKLSREMEW